MNLIPSLNPYLAAEELFKNCKTSTGKTKNVEDILSPSYNFNNYKLIKCSSNFMASVAFDIIDYYGQELQILYIKNNIPIPQRVVDELKLSFFGETNLIVEHQSSDFLIIIRTKTEEFFEEITKSFNAFNKAIELKGLDIDEEN